MFEGKSLLISGGTGSLGNAIVARLIAAEDCPRRIVVYSRDEYKQSVMAERFPDPRLRFVLGDVRDKARLYRAFDGVDMVIHAAALKQVPALEYSPIEGILTNVMGAANVIDAAIDRGVERVIGISSDKATSPVNLYGATKLCAEKLFIAANNYVGKHVTKFSVLRYGNVAKSRGSVIPIWQEHAAECLSRHHGHYPRQGGLDTPFTREAWRMRAGESCSGINLTDERMTRFWITLDQAVDFVLARLEGMVGAEVFVPKLPSVRMTDVAKAVAPDCRINITGIRPGEKLAEAMIGPDEPYDYNHPWGFTLHPGGVAHSQYDSASNDQWLGPADIRAALGLTKSASRATTDHPEGFVYLKEMPAHLP